MNDRELLLKQILAQKNKNQRLRDHHEQMKEKVEEVRTLEAANDAVLSQNTQEHQMPPLPGKHGRGQPSGASRLVSSGLNKNNSNQRVSTAPQGNLHMFGRPRTAAMLLNTAADMQRPYTGTVPSKNKNQTRGRSALGMTNGFG